MSMLHKIRNNPKSPIWFGLATFAVLMAITQYVAFQRYLISKDREKELLNDEMYATKDRIRNILNNDITAANTLAIIYKEYGIPKNFDSICRQIVNSSRNYADAIQITKNGIITNVYPPAEYKTTIGINTLTDSMRRHEEQKAFGKRDIYFVGPRPLRMGGVGILAKLPIIVNGKVEAMVVVLTKMSTIEKALDLNHGNTKFSYQLTKSDGGDTANYLLTSSRPYTGSLISSVSMPEGNWTLSVAYATAFPRANILWLGAFGILVSVLGAAMVYYRTKQSLQLKKMVATATHNLGERVKELSTIFQVNEILKDDQQSTGEVFQKIVDILPDGWQYPDSCAAKIIFNKRAYTTANYLETRFKQQANIALQDGRSGCIEVCYLEDMPHAYEGPFLREERNLINTLAETIQVYFNKKIHQDAVASSEANLKAIIESSQVGFMLCDRELSIIATNHRMTEKYKQLVGRNLNVGDNFAEALLPDRQEAVKQLMLKVISDREPVEYDTSYTIDSGTIYTTVSVAPVVNNRAVIGLCLAAYDITARKEMEIERQQFIEGLEKRNKALEEYAHVLSHEVRAPIATMLGLSNILAGADEVEQKIIVEGITQSANHLDKLVKELNAVMRVQAEDVIA